jgi:hypothetical protein
MRQLFRFRYLKVTVCGRIVDSPKVGERLPESSSFVKIEGSGMKVYAAAVRFVCSMRQREGETPTLALLWQNASVSPSRSLCARPAYFSLPQ